MIHDHPHVVPVAHNLYVGAAPGCDDIHSHFEKVLHIWRDDHYSNSCKFVKERLALGSVVEDSRNLVLNYRDGESLTEGMIETAASFLKGTKETLIHCAVGQTRSPTLAVLGKLVRGANISQAIGDVAWRIWEKRKVPVNIVYIPLKDILTWSDKRS